MGLFSLKKKKEKEKKHFKKKPHRVLLAGMHLLYIQTKHALVCFAVYCTYLEGARSDQKNKNLT